MAESTNFPGTSRDNVIDKAANSATSAVDATKAATNAALDSVADRVESLRSALAPMVDDGFSSLTRYTREKPLNALLAAVAVGAFVSTVMRRRR